jgi:TonB family protein
MPRDEMHRLEKAALDDPFLAEALEGMMLSGGDEAWKDLGELKENLRIRIEGPQETTGFGGESSAPTAGDPDDRETGVYPMRPSIDSGTSAPRIGWRPWRIAASIALFIGLGLLTTWMIQREWGKDKTIASRMAGQNETDSTAAVAETSAADAQRITAADSQVVAARPSAAAPSNIPSADKTPPSPGTGKTDTSVSTITAAPVRTAPPEQAEPSISKATPPVAQSDNRAGERVIGYAQQNRARTVPAASGKITGPYVYTGQVRNTEGQPLSFVNIRLEPAGTSQYTDARGQFRILSADSALTLQLKAYGYTNKSAQLLAHHQNKPLTLTLQPAANRSKAKPSPKPKASSREEMTKLDETTTDTTGIPEAEPRDGWAAYALYLLNNVRMPQDAYLQKLHGTVLVSFQVDAYGRLSDFRVEKSLSPSCDREAIRLVREGPPWDLYNSDRPLRARVTVVF